MLKRRQRRALVALDQPRVARHVERGENGQFARRAHDTVRGFIRRSFFETSGGGKDNSL
ncbi:MAG: hypothetical protein WD626_03385 [Bauldia sp.]